LGAHPRPTADLDEWRTSILIVSRFRVGPFFPKIVPLQAKVKTTALLTGGVGNAVLALLELAGATLLSLLAILAPALVLFALALLPWLLARIVRGRQLAARTPRPRE